MPNQNYEFREGDIVRTSATCSGAIVDNEYEVVNANGTLSIGERRADGGLVNGGCAHQEYWTLIRRKDEVASFQQKLKTKKSNRMNPKIKISLEKDGSKVSIKIKIPKELEEFFKTLAEEKTSVSQKWLKGKEGAEFYNLTEEYNKVKNILSTNIINDFGNGLYFNGQINIAPLRCVGASLEKGIELSSARNWDISGLDLEYYIRELGNAAKKIWQGFIAKSKIRAIISFEL